MPQKRKTKKATTRGVRGRVRKMSINKYSLKPIEDHQDLPRKENKKL